jgi:hypothetical protein
MAKTNWPKSVADIYREAGLPEDIIINLECLEFLHPSVENLLEEYRYIQPDGELFSERSLRIIIRLHDMKNILESQREIMYSMESSLNELIQLIFRQGKASLEYDPLYDHSF